MLPDRSPQELEQGKQAAPGQHLGLNKPAYENLKASGLSDEYIRKMRIQQLKDSEDYAIPYFNVDGTMRMDFYRTRLIRTAISLTKNKVPKYLQPKDSPNHVWLPPNIVQLLHNNDPRKQYLIITEGEKKAASVAQHGIPAIALGGVDSWRSSRHLLDLKAFKKTDTPGKVLVNLKEVDLEVMNNQVAEELIAIATHLQATNKAVYIIFDTDSVEGLKKEVQTAAFHLALWLSGRGAEDIRLAVLPAAANGKMGLDDFVVKYGPEKLEEFLEQPEHTFPTHPDLKRWIESILGSPKKINRITLNNIARAIIASLDKKGNRFVDEAGRFYYFDSRTKILHTFSLGSQDLRNFRLDSFGILLSSEFGIGTSDSGMLSRIADAFVSIPGIHTTTPRRVVYTTSDTLYYQLSDSRVAKVTEDRIQVVDNGTDGMLFLSGQVNPIEHKLSHKRSDKPRWIEVLEQTSVQPMEGMTLEETHILLACMFYLNPWFRRWRGLMLPIEIAIAEPNSGKSFMYNLRLAILTGRPTLQHGPTTVRDWYADLTSTPAMWVGDNLGRIPNTMRNSMSDELARLVTDPSPSISMRKLYTTAENTRLPVDCSFAMTAINNPFTREDIMQRSIIISLKAVPAGARDGQWYNREIENGGRETWLADHLVIAQKFLKEVKRGWDKDYLSNHRLVNFEQSLLVMARVLGYGEEMPIIIGKLTHVVQENIAQFNPVIESLRAFVSHRVEVGLAEEPFFASEIIDWAISSLDFAHVKVLQDARQLGKYFSGHAYDIEQSTGITKIEGRRDGKARYAIDMVKAEKFIDAD